MHAKENVTYLGFPNHHHHVMLCPKKAHTYPLRLPWPSSSSGGNDDSEQCDLFVWQRLVCNGLFGNDLFGSC